LTTFRGDRSPEQETQKQAIETLVLTSSEPGALRDHDLLELLCCAKVAGQVSRVQLFESRVAL
jgi:hypothetical protein